MNSLERKRKRIVRQNFREWLSQKFRIQIVNEDEQRSVVSRSINRLDCLILLAVFVAIVSVASISLFKASPSQRREIDRDNSLRQQLVADALRLDSLEAVVSNRDFYIQNIQNILTGKISVDSVSSIDSITSVDNNLMLDESDVEKLFVEQYEEEERYNVTSQTPMASDVQARNLFRPTVGMVTEPFNRQQKHYGVDIAANPNESVMSVMDGTVVLSSYTSETGYVICIYHSDDMVSVYKFCSTLLKKEGEKVKAGDVIALVGNTGTAYSSSHLHFELWYEGQPLDPQQYIVF